jgi:hypothetical protein
MTASRKVIVATVLVAGAAVATAVATQGSASRDEARLSNTGRQQVAVRGLVIGSEAIDQGRVLAVQSGRALYRLDRANDTPCFGIGPSKDIGNVEAATCPRGGFPRGGQPVLDFSVYESTRHDVRDLSLYRVEGFAADGIAAVRFLRPNGSVAFSVPVVGNAYVTRTVPDGPIAGFAALDKTGKEVWRSP